MSATEVVRLGFEIVGITMMACLGIVLICWMLIATWHLVRLMWEFYNQ